MMPNDVGVEAACSKKVAKAQNSKNDVGHASHACANVVVDEITLAITVVLKMQQKEPPRTWSQI